MTIDVSKVYTWGLKNSIAFRTSTGPLVTGTLATDGLVLFPALLWCSTFTMRQRMAVYFFFCVS